MWKVLEEIMPSIANIQASNKIKIKISQKRNLNLPSQETVIENLSKDDLNKLYNDDMRWKERLEDKAKTNVIGVTISVTLIMGAYSQMHNILDKFSTNIIFWLSFCLFVLSVIYMVASGIHAIHVLTAENIIYCPALGLNNEDWKKDLDLIIGLNRAQNTLRNNYVYTSYECIRNALICLFVVMVIAIVPVKDTKKQSQSYSHGNFYYSEQAMNTINGGIDRDVVESYISTNLRNGEFSTIDQIDNLFLKYAVDNDNVIVYLVEPID